MKRITLFLALMCMIITASQAKDNDFGLQLSAGASHKFNKQWTLGAGVEMRTRNDFRTMDRWSVGADASYKFWKYLKLSASYTLLIDNNIEKINYDEYDELINWRPSYWGVRHRVCVSLTGSYAFDRVTFSLRERWQLTCRPETTVDRYDFVSDGWEEKVVDNSAKNVLRSRIQVEYNIPRSKVDPYANVEFFNAWRLQRTRVIVGANWKINKKNELGFFYRFQTSPDEANFHMFGAAYSFKF